MGNSTTAVITWEVIAAPHGGGHTGSIVNPPKETIMNQATHQAARIAEAYLAAWNERAPAARRTKVAQVFAPDASYLDPMMRGSGVDGIDAMIGAAQQQFPGCRFALHGTPSGHHDVVRFSWSLAADAPDAAPLAIGTDFATVDAEGRLVRVTGFLDAA
jgi:hypothetical protein